ncbi:hypothetical protein MRBLBA71_001776 [Bacillus nitratireducens]|uniref:hypothetical protein n=1 Tax=Bacillus nitratireducens TaxID=2026193 RepID=UPI003465DFB7
MNKKKIGLLILVIIILWFVFPLSPYLADLNYTEQKLYDKLQKSQDIYTLKEQKPKTIVRLYLHSIQEKNYEITYLFYKNDEKMTEKKKQFLKEASEFHKTILSSFRFARSSVIINEDYKDSAVINMPPWIGTNIQFHMYKKNGTWFIYDVPFQ